MKIATIIPKLAGGGAERVAANMSHFWSESISHDFIVFEQREYLYSFKGEVINLEEPNQSGKVQKLFALINRFKKIRKQKAAYAISMSHLYVPNILNALSGGRAKSVLFIHGPASLFQNKIEKVIAKRAYHKADYIVSVSKYFEHYAKMQLGIPDGKIQTIYNPMDFRQMDTQKLEELSVVEKEIFEKPVFINVGRISKQKGQWHAIKAFSKIQQNRPDAQLVFLGRWDNSLKEKMLEYVKSYKLEGHVHFLGNVSNPFKYLYNAFALFYTSLWDALPTVVIESMACDLPVISSDCDSGPREIMAPHTDFLKRTEDLEKTSLGYLCPTCSDSTNLGLELSKEEKAFASAGIELLNDAVYYKKIQQNGRRRAMEFDGTHIIKQYEDLCKKLVKNE